MGRLVGDEDVEENPGGQAGRVDCVGGGGEGLFAILFLFRLTFQAPPLELCAPRTLGLKDFCIVAVMVFLSFGFCTGLHIPQG